MPKAKYAKNTVSAMRPWVSMRGDLNFMKEMVVKAR
jgi:hypothetical protein